MRRAEIPRPQELLTAPLVNLGPEKDIRDWITNWNDKPNLRPDRDIDEILERLASHLNGFLA